MTVYAQKNLSRRAIEVAFCKREGPREFFAVPMQVEFEEADGFTPIEPSLRLTWEDGQELLQALWDCGLRPNDGEGSSGQVAALKAHVAFAERVAITLLQPQGTPLIK